MKFISFIILCAVLTACHSNHSSIQKSNSSSFSSIQTGKTDIPTKSPMLNEILTAKIETKGKFVPGQRRDVSGIVSKYIPIGTSREQVKQILASMNQDFKEEGNIIHAGYREKFIPMVPQGGVMIKLTFNELNFLETIDAKLSYQQ